MANGLRVGVYVWRGALLGSALKGAKQAFSPPDIILRSIVQTIEQAILGWANGVWLGCMWRGERCAYELRVELRAPARVRTGACQRVRVPWGTGNGARQLTPFILICAGARLITGPPP